MFLSHFLTGSKLKTEHHLIHTFSNVILTLKYRTFLSKMTDNFESDFVKFSNESRDDFDAAIFIRMGKNICK